MTTERPVVGRLFNQVLAVLLLIAAQLPMATAGWSGRSMLSGVLFATLAFCVALLVELAVLRLAFGARPALPFGPARWSATPLSWALIAAGAVLLTGMREGWALPRPLFGYTAATTGFSATLRTRVSEEPPRRADPDKVSCTGDDAVCSGVHETLLRGGDVVAADIRVDDGGPVCWVPLWKQLRIQVRSDVVVSDGVHVDVAGFADGMAAGIMSCHELRREMGKVLGRALTKEISTAVRK